MKTSKRKEEAESQNGYKCLETEWINCIPSTRITQPECRQDYLEWAEKNCPGFKGVAY